MKSNPHGQEPEKVKIRQQERPGRGMYRPRRFYLKIAAFPKSRAEEKSRKRDTLREIMKKGAK